MRPARGLAAGRLLCAFAWVSLALGAGCGTDDDGPRGPACIHSYDCGSDRVCRDEECVDPRTACASDDACVAGYACDGGVCERADSACDPAVGLCHVSSAAGLERVGTVNAVAFTDLDGDGLPDILAGGVLLRVFRNRGDGTFEDVMSPEGSHALVAGIGRATGIACGDYDNDGDTDIFLNGWGGAALLRNLGDMQFEDVRSSSGIAELLSPPPGSPASVRWAASWGDVDADGRLDLFSGYMELVQPGGGAGDPGTMPARLLRGREDGTFEDATAATGLGHPGKIHSAVFLDTNGDADVDAIISHDFVHPFLYRNDGRGMFEDVSDEVGLAEFPGSSPMGIAVGDVDEDGALDILFADTVADQLFLHRGEQGFRSFGAESGLAPLTEGSVGWGVVFRDFDLDGHLDLFEATGDIDIYGMDARHDHGSIFALGHGDGTFTEHAPSASLLDGYQTNSYAAAAADYDGDGDLDVLVGNYGPPGVDGLHLYRNDLGGRRGWIGIALRGSASNRQGLGSIVRLRSSGRWRTSPVLTGGSFFSCSPPVAMFALAEGEEVEAVEVAWASGPTISYEPPFETRRVIVLEEP